MIGGAGQTGRAVTARLRSAGCARHCHDQARSAGYGPPPADEWQLMDRRGEGRLDEIVGGGFELLVDVLAFDADDARQLASLGDRIGSAVVISTASVYTDAEGRSLDEAEGEASFPNWPVPIPETQARLPAGDATYSTRKVALEETLLAEAPFPVTIVRPGAIHGPGGRHLREWYFVKRAIDGRRHVVLPYDGTSIFQPTSVHNLAELVAAAAWKPGRRAVNCGDPEPPTVRRIGELVGEVLGHRFEAVLVTGPPPAPNVGDHPWTTPKPVVLDMQLAAAELGYGPVTSYEGALEESCRWAVEATAGKDWREVLPTLAGYPMDLFDYEAEDRYLAGRSDASG